GWVTGGGAPSPAPSPAPSYPSSPWQTTYTPPGASAGPSVPVLPGHPGPGGTGGPTPPPVPPPSEAPRFHAAPPEAPRPGPPSVIEADTGWRVEPAPRHEQPSGWPAADRHAS